VYACVPVVYVTDIGTSVAFYGLLGFACEVDGEDAEWRWSYLKCGEVGVLLAAGGSVWTADPGPVLLYLRSNNIGGIERALKDADMPFEHLGYPDHAPGGELKVVDPDGHTLMIGQITGMQPEGRQPSPQERSSILARAAAATRARGGAPHRCQISTSGGACPAPADVKLADSWGDTAWTCLPHAEEALINARSAFIAAEDSEGLARFLRRRHSG
jgi:hypothetical protein